MASDKGYLVAKMVRMGKEQTIALPGPINPNATDAAEQKIILDEAVKAIAKQRTESQRSGISACKKCARSWRAAKTGIKSGGNISCTNLYQRLSGSVWGLKTTSRESSTGEGVEDTVSLHTRQ